MFLKLTIPGQDGYRLIEEVADVTFDQGQLAAELYNGEMLCFDLEAPVYVLNDDGATIDRYMPKIDPLQVFVDGVAYYPPVCLRGPISGATILENLPASTTGYYYLGDDEIVELGNYFVPTEGNIFFTTA
jgi:hypothetical protein